MQHDVVHDVVLLMYTWHTIIQHFKIEPRGRQLSCRCRRNRTIHTYIPVFDQRLSLYDTHHNNIFSFYSSSSRQQSRLLQLSNNSVYNYFHHTSMPVLLTPSELQSRCGDKALNFQVICPQSSPKRGCSPTRVNITPFMY